MAAFYIILAALWIYPVLGLVIVWLTRNKPPYLKKITLILFTVSALCMTGVATHISTTLYAIDWFLISLIYLTMMILLSLFIFMKRIWVKITGILLMIIISTTGYIMGSIGIIGIGFIVGEFVPDKEIMFENGIIYKESMLGNAVSDKKGRLVEVYKTIAWFPFIEWRISSKKYDNYMETLHVEYSERYGKVYLSVFSPPYSETGAPIWCDSLSAR